MESIVWLWVAVSALCGSSLAAAARQQRWPQLPTAAATGQADSPVTQWQPDAPHRPPAPHIQPWQKCPSKPCYRQQNTWREESEVSEVVARQGRAGNTVYTLSCELNMAELAAYRGDLISKVWTFLFILEAEHGYASSLPSPNEYQMNTNKNLRLKSSTKKPQGSR